MCRLTEQVIFMDPFYAAAVNKHTSPQLDDDAQGLYTDVEAKVAVSELKVRGEASVSLLLAPLYCQVAFMGFGLFKSRACMLPLQVLAELPTSHALQMHNPGSKA